MNIQPNHSRTRTHEALVCIGVWLDYFTLFFCVALMVPIWTISISAQETTINKQPDPVQTASPRPNAAPNNPDKEKEDDKQTDQDKPKKAKRGSLILAPIPIVSPALGTGLVMGAGYVLKLKEEDKLSPPSTIAGAFVFTNNGTRAGVLGADLHFGENKYQATMVVGNGRANFEFFGIGRIPGQPAISVPMKVNGAVFYSEFMRNVGKKIFIGPRYQYRKLSTSLGGQTTPGGFVIPAIDLRSTSAAIGFRVLRDLRDNSFYPTKGSLWDFKGDFFANALGSNRTYQTYKATYNGYRTVGKDQVLAYRGMACSVSDKTPFFDLCYFGSNSDLRGYTTGQFQNRRMVATQLEYRREMKWRLGLVGFAGVGGVARRWSDFRFDELLPAAGAGIRFKLDKKNHINYRVDFGYGRTGHTVSMSVTEAF